MKKNMRIWRAFICLIFCFDLMAQEGVESSQTPTSEMAPAAQAHFKSIAGQLRCPTCTGLSVLDSDAAFSLQIQALVKEQIQQGKDEDKILDYFVARYGPWILREPPKKGANLFAWIFPLLLMIGGPCLVWVFVWRKRSKLGNNEILTRSRQDIVAEFESELARLRTESV